MAHRILTSAPVLGVVVLLALAVDARAHGGSYRRPPVPRIPTPGPSLPTPTPPIGGGGTVTPAPGIPGGGGIVRGPRRPPPAPPADDLRWHVWWNLNRDRFLQVRRQVEAQRTETPSDAPERDWKGESIRALLEALGDRHPDVSTGAAIALGKSGDPRATEPLIEALHVRTRDRTIREAAALALGMLATDDARAALVEVALDRKSHSRLRAFAAYGLGLTKSSAALPTLATLVRDETASAETRAAALVSLGILGDEIVAPILIDAVKGKVRRLGSWERACAIDGLGRLGDPAGLEVLLKGATVKDAWLRQASALALGRMGPDEDRVYSTLRHLSLHDENRVTRAFATIALGRTGRPEATVICLDLADRAKYLSQKGFAILGAAIAARESGDEATIERTAGWLRTRLARRKFAQELQSAAAIGLGILRDRKSLKILTDIVGKHGDPDLRGHAAVALAMIGDREALPVLRKSLDPRGDPNLLRETALALGLLGDSESTRTLIELVQEGRTEWIRANAALGLARIGGPEAALAMVDLLKDRRSSGPTRGMAAVALGHLLDARPLPALTAIVEDMHYRIPLDAVQEVVTIL